MREEIEELLRLTRQLERDAAALSRAICAAFGREAPQRVAPAAGASLEPWRWN